VLHGKPVDKVPFTIYEYKIPQCAIERQLRNDGMCIVNRRHVAYSVSTPHCTSESYHYSEDGLPRVKTVVRTPAGKFPRSASRRISPVGR